MSAIKIIIQTGQDAPQEYHVLAPTVREALLTVAAEPDWQLRIKPSEPTAPPVGSDLPVETGALPPAPAPVSAAPSTVDQFRADLDQKIAAAKEWSAYVRQEGRYTDRPAEARGRLDALVTVRRQLDVIALPTDDAHLLGWGW